MNSPDPAEAPSTRILVTVILAFAAVFSLKSVLLFAGTTIGLDYSLYYPKLGAYLFWIERNGFFSIPHFLPYTCAGIFDFSDPQSFYFSFPTAAAALLPIGTVWPLTTIAFGAIGAAGGYALVRLGASARRSPAALCGLLVLCNGFFLTRMAVGHVIFHGFMLTPWVALFCLKPSPQAALRRHLPATAAIGLAYAYLVYSGGVQIIVPSVLSVSILILAVPRDSRGTLAAAGKLVAGGMVGLVISLPKVAETLYLKANLDRGFYPLPGFPDLGDALSFAVSTLFFEPSETALGSIVNSAFPIDLHEAIYGVGMIPLAALAFHAARRYRTVTHAGLFAKISVRGVLLVLALALPILLNLHIPEWTAILKTVPLLRESSQLLRFMIVYIVPLAFAAALVFERHVAGTVAERPLFLASALVLVITLIQMDLERFARNGYPQRSIENALARHPGTLRTPIRAVSAEIREGRIRFPVGRDDLFLKGESQAACYQPLFGYRLEKFKFDNLGLGPAKAITGGSYNFHNPSCYVFPKENHCLPGDNFRKEQGAALEAFLDYGPLEHNRPAYLNGLAILALIALAGCLVASALGLRHKLQEPAPEDA